jgi:hypothetical protein
MRRTPTRHNEVEERAYLAGRVVLALFVVLMASAVLLGIEMVETMGERGTGYYLLGVLVFLWLTGDDSQKEKSKRRRPRASRPRPEPAATA